jgi:hypothetical protein
MKKTFFLSLAIIFLLCACGYESVKYNGEIDREIDVAADSIDAMWSDSSMAILGRWVILSLAESGADTNFVRYEMLPWRDAATDARIIALMRGLLFSERPLQLSDGDALLDSVNFFTPFEWLKSGDGDGWWVKYINAKGDVVSEFWKIDMGENSDVQRNIAFIKCNKGAGVGKEAVVKQPIVSEEGVVAFNLGGGKIKVARIDSGGVWQEMTYGLLAADADTISGPMLVAPVSVLWSTLSVLLAIPLLAIGCFIIYMIFKHDKPNGEQ